MAVLLSKRRKIAINSSSVGKLGVECRDDGRARGLCVLNVCVWSC